MKIVIPVLSVGPSGGYRVISELASAWVRKGHSVFILARWSGEKPYFPTLAEFIWIDDGGARIDPSSAANVPHRSGFNQVYHNLLALWHGLRREGRNADVLMANHSLTTYPVYFSRCTGKKYYYIQAYEPETIKRHLLKWIMHISYYLPLKQIANSPFYLNYKNVKAADFVPPGINLSIMFPENKKSRNGNNIILGCIGSKSWFKGIDNILDAYRLLRERGVPVELRIAYGLIPDGYRLPSDAEVVIPNNDCELGEFYRSVDILIAPGKLQHGSAHYPVMEAMACGIVVITTGYLPASMEANNSWIVRANNHVEIANAVESIIANPALREQRIQKALVDIQAYSWDTVATKMLSLFEK